MSKYFSTKLSSLVPYVPGEQPKDMKYVKLNTNESPFAPSPKTMERAKEVIERLNLYSDPEMTLLRKSASKVLGVGENNIVFTNGSDEVLNFAFIAYGEGGVVFPDITYGFYPVFASLNNIEYKTIPLKEDFSIDYRDYLGLNKTIVIANPNAPTGMDISLDQIEKILLSNPDSVVVIDEAYVDFGATSCAPLTKKYKNLLCVQTFSKSRSMAGARLGFAIADKEIIADLDRVKYSTNPYNVNSLTQIAGRYALIDNDYYMNNAKLIIKAREWTQEELKKLGFETLDSKANFIFAKSDKIDGESLYKALKDKGVLVRYFTKERIKDFNRITVGSLEEMQTFIEKVKEILGEQK